MERISSDERLNHDSICTPVSVSLLHLEEKEEEEEEEEEEEGWKERENERISINFKILTSIK